MRGFSLLELILVVAVLTIAATISAPSVGRTVDGVRARAEVGAIAAFLRSARERAVSRQEPLEVTFDVQGHALALRRMNGGAAASSRALSARLRLRAATSPTRVTFYPQGRSSGGRVAIEAPGPRTYLITVDALTGRVSLGRDGA